MAFRLTVLAGTVTACAAPAATRAGNGGSWPAGRTFVSSSLTGHTLVAGTHISLTFRHDASVSAYAGCNNLSGTGRIADGRLIVGEIRQTQMGCDPDRMNQDEWLVRFLTAKPTWHLAGDQLQLISNTARLTLTDRAGASTVRGLAGTRWVVDAIITGHAASSVPSGTAAYLTFGNDGHISGTTGCAPITGTAVIGNTTMIVALLPSDERACTGEAATVDTAVRDTLRGTVGYTIGSDTLTLNGPDDHGLRLRASS